MKSEKSFLPERYLIKFSFVFLCDVEMLPDYFS